MSSLTELKQSETQGDFPLDEAQGLLGRDWKIIFGKEVDGYTLDGEG